MTLSDRENAGFRIEKAPFVKGETHVETLIIYRIDFN